MCVTGNVHAVHAVCLCVFVGEELFVCAFFMQNTYTVQSSWMPSSTVLPSTTSMLSANLDHLFTDWKHMWLGVCSCVCVCSLYTRCRVVGLSEWWNCTWRLPFRNDVNRHFATKQLKPRPGSQPTRVPVSDIWHCVFKRIVCVCVFFMRTYKAVMHLVGTGAATCVAYVGNALLNRETIRSHKATTPSNGCTEIYILHPQPPPYFLVRILEHTHEPFTHFLTNPFLEMCTGSCWKLHVSAGAHSSTYIVSTRRH